MKKIALTIISLLFLFCGVGNTTVTGTTDSISYTCAGTTGPFAFTFPVTPDQTALVITKADTYGIAATLTSSDYTATPANKSYLNGGSITLTTACPSGYTIKILRNTPQTQASVFTEGMPTLYKTFERSLDKLTMITQDMQLKLNNDLSLLPTPVANNYIGWNAGATALENKTGPVSTTATQYEIDALISYGGGVNFTQATIEAALTAVGTTNKVTLLLRPGNWVVSTALAFPANVAVDMPAGSYFSGAAVTAGLITGLKTVTPEMFGAAGDKTTDDVTAFQNAVLNTDNYGTLLLTGAYRIGSVGLTINKPVNITGQGYIWLDVGTSVDGITLGNSSTYTEDFKWDFKGIFGAASSCRNGLIIKNVNRANFDIYLYMGTSATGKAVWIQNYAIANNYAFNVGAGNLRLALGAAAPQNGVYAASSAGDSTGTAFNANDFDCWITGVTDAGLTIITGGENGNNDIKGNYEGNGGYGIHIKGGKRVHLHDIHSEDLVGSANQIVIENHTLGTIGHGVNSYALTDSFSDVKFIASSNNFIDGLLCAQLEFDATSNNNYVNKLAVGGQAHSKVVNSGTGNSGVYVSTSTGGNGINGTSDNTSIASNGSFERWTSTTVLPGWAMGVGGTVTRETTIKMHGKSSAMVDTAGATQHLRGDNILVAAFPQVKTVAVTGSVYIPTTGGNDVVVLVYKDSGATSAQVATITTRDAWTRFSAVIDVSAAATNFYPVFMSGVAGASKFYVDAVSVIPATVSGNISYTPNSNEFPKYTGSATWDPASISAGSYLAKDFTVLGAALGMVAYAGAGIDVADLTVSATVTASDTVTVVLYNGTAGAIDLASSTWRVVAIDISN